MFERVDFKEAVDESFIVFVDSSSDDHFYGGWVESVFRRWRFGSGEKRPGFADCSPPPLVHSTAGVSDKTVATRFPSCRYQLLLMCHMRLWLYNADLSLTAKE
jgi:hypothetical protein